jgi:hypothetical protein
MEMEALVDDESRVYRLGEAYLSINQAEMREHYLGTPRREKTRSLLISSSPKSSSRRNLETGLPTA